MRVKSNLDASNIILLLTVLFAKTSALYCQELIKINSDNGINKITYLLSSIDREIDIVLSSSIIGIEEYSFNKDEVSLEFEDSPPFLTFRCLSGNCIKCFNYSKEESKAAFPILLTNDHLQNEKILRDVQKLIDDKLSLESHHKRSFINLLQNPSGTYGIKVQLNDIINETFILDSGASLICINSVVFNKLKDKGSIREYDLFDKINTIIADGSMVKNLLINIKKVKIEDYEFTNIKCLVSDTKNAPLLLGQNILKAFGLISIDYENNRLYIIN